MIKIQPEGHKRIKGYTVYLTKQASKLLGTSTIEVRGSIYPKFDSTREMWQLPQLFELSKESVLMIEYHHEKSETHKTTTSSSDDKSEDFKNPKHWVYQGGNSLNPPTIMFDSQETQEKSINNHQTPEDTIKYLKEIETAAQQGYIKL